MSNEHQQAFLEQRHKETLTELEAVRGTLKDLNAQLADAEEALRFYADPRHYGISNSLASAVFQDVLKEDFSHPDNNVKTFIAGSRARKYIDKYDKK